MRLKCFYLLFIYLLPTAVLAQEDTKNIELDEVVVKSSRMELRVKDIPQKVEIIKKSTIDAIPNQNLGDILKRTTNLDIIEYPGALTTVGMRGFPAKVHNRSYTLLLIDSKPAGTNNLATIPADFIERIEVIKGPYSILYGSDAMGGVINVITKVPSKIPTGNVGVSVGNFGQTFFSGYVSGAISQKLLLSMGFTRKEQSTDYRIGASSFLKLSETEKNILDKKSFGDVMTNTKYQINQFNGKLNYLINSKWSTDLYSVLTVSNDIETPGNYWHSYGMSKKDINRFANYLDIRRSDDNNELVVSPYVSVQNEANYNNNSDSAFIDSKESIKQYGVRIGNTHTWGLFKLLTGVDYDGFKVTSQRFTDKVTEMNPYRPNNLRQSLSGFAQLAYSWNNLFVNGGLRYNYITYSIEANEMLKNAEQKTHYSNVNPSVGVKYRVTDMISLHSSVGNAFYAPDSYMSAGMYKIGKKVYVGNANLRSETSTSYDVGVNYGLGDRFCLDMTYFQGFYRNKIVTDNSRKDTVSYKNAKGGMMNGIELLLSSNIARFWNAPYRLEVYGGVTYFFNNNFKDSVKNDKGVTQLLTRDMLYTRRVTGNLGVGFQNNKGFEVRLDARYIGHRLENDYMSYDGVRPAIQSFDYYTGGGFTKSDMILRHPTHFIFDLSTHYAINKKVRVGISVANMLDENYTEKDGYNLPGRSVMGHLNFQF